MITVWAVILVLALAGCSPTMIPSPVPITGRHAHGQRHHAHESDIGGMESGSPAIRTEHILYGGINHEGEATGFHYRATGEASGRARIVPGSESAPDSHGVYQARVEIRDPASGRWVDKNVSSTFYPDAWSQAQVLAEIRSAFAHRRPGRGNHWEGVSESGVRIGGYTDESGTITTAYPLQERN